MQDGISDAPEIARGAWITEPSRGPADGTARSALLPKARGDAGHVHDPREKSWIFFH